MPKDYFNWDDKRRTSISHEQIEKENILHKQDIVQCTKRWDGGGVQLNCGNAKISNCLLAKCVPKGNNERDKRKQAHASQER